MSNLEELYKKLKKYSNFQEIENIDLFLDTVGEVVNQKNPEAIPELIKYCDDDCEYDVISESLPQSILWLLNEDGIKKLIPYLNNFFEKSPDICMEVISILFNKREDYEAFKRNAKILDDGFFLTFLDSLEQSSPHHHDLIEELRKEFLSKEG